MTQIRLDASARAQLREIRRYSAAQWGREQADAYVRRLSSRFDDIAAGRAFSRVIPAIMGVDGYFCTCGRHFIYWRWLGDDAVAIVAILHQSMHQPGRVRLAFGLSP